MKVLIVTVCAFAMAFAAPAQRTAEELAAIRALPALEHDEVHDEFGQYALRYVTAEGIIVSERARLVPNHKGDGYVLITEGEVSYIGDDGQIYITKFSAGLDGTKVEVNHMPVASEPIIPSVSEIHEISKSEPVTTVTETVPELVVTICAFAVAFAAPAQRTAEELAAIRALPALEHDEVHDEFGQYALRYVTAEGIIVSERARLVPNHKGDGYVLITEGEVSYIGDDGQVYITKFSAGLDGTKVEVNHMPVASEPIIPSVSEIHEISKSEPITTVTETVPEVSKEHRSVIPIVE